MTVKVFWQDPYLTEIETIIQTIDGNRITVDKTIFYAFSGGQESDAGTIAGRKVVEAQKLGRQIYYTLESTEELEPGMRVPMIIDWARRYNLMKLHFAAEIVLELICKKYSEAVKVGAHIAQEKARIDFEWGQSMSPLLPRIQEDAQAIINSNQDIISAFSDEASERRFWEINEFGQVPCGGTHLRKTGEIGSLGLKRVNPGKGRERVEIYLSREPDQVAE